METQRELRKFLVVLAKGSAAEQALGRATDATMNGLQVIACSRVEPTGAGLLRLRRIPTTTSPDAPVRYQIWWVQPRDVAAILEFDGEPPNTIGFVAKSE